MFVSTKLTQSMFLHYKNSSRTIKLHISLSTDTVLKLTFLFANRKYTFAFREDTYLLEKLAP